jgi:predicted nucleotidyltransferase
MATEQRRPTERRIPSMDDPTLAEVVDRLVQTYRPQKVYLFGSAARGDAGLDSDYDVLVVVPDDLPASRRDERLGYAALVGTGTSVDVLVYRASEFYGRLPLRASLPATVVREGTLLYAA